MIHPDIAAHITTIRTYVGTGKQFGKALAAVDALEDLLTIPDSHGPGHIDVDDPIVGIGRDLGLDEDVVIADHIDTASVTASAPAMPPAGLLCGLLLTAYIARRDGSIANTPAKVFLMGTPDHLRAMGTTIRDGLRSAADVAEKGLGG